MAFHTKKGIMGIGTLIIFIATILVAAVAAAVLISTSNVLQQRSLLVGQEARKSITNAVDVVSILAASDASIEKFNNFEILVRLSPGSDPLQMRKFNIQYIASEFDHAANLLHDDNETVVQLDDAIDPSTNVTTYEMDDDRTPDWVTLRRNVSGDNEGLAFYLTDKDQWSDPVSLGRDLSNAGTSNVTILLGQQPVTLDEQYFGYVSVRGVTNADDTITANVNVTVDEIPDKCEFELLPPEDYYCYEVMNGNDDYVLGSGERFKIYYKLRDEHEISIGEDLMFIFTTEKGRISEARARTPDVITSTKTKLWPLG